ncbi:MAG: EFR1 family ferrodoxin [Anaerolineales bacterium]|nr:EFR1 family ferrodoxin [Anaerolineales bacterium]
MNTQIYYFSGTGNSLHVAKALRKRLGETDLVPMVREANRGKTASSAEVVGLVFPIHNLTSPDLVRQFLRRADLGSTKYLFAVATRECSDKVFHDLDRILAAQGKSLDAWFIVAMPCTYIPLFTLPSKNAAARMEADLQGKLNDIQAAVAEKRVDRYKDDPLVFLLGRILYPPISEFFFRARFPEMARSFHADSKCTGCGLCERVCPSGRIRIQNGKPEWSASINCLYCFACLHWCPVEAVQIRGRNTVGKGRYHHPAVTAAEIARQKIGMEEEE